MLGLLLWRDVAAGDEVSKGELTLFCPNDELRRGELTLLFCNDEVSKGEFTLLFCNNGLYKRKIKTSINSANY